MTPIPENTLRNAAARRGLLVGAAVDSDALTTERDYADVLAREYNAVTPENVMKWMHIHPDRGRYDFTAADALVTFAQQHGMEVRGHTLVWHSYNPAWLEQGSWTRDEAIAELLNHISTVVGRYRGQVGQWDVVNEAIAHDGTLRDSVWLRTIGPDYIGLAFQFAHDADPAARLYYNDYSIEAPGAKQDAVFELVRSLRDGGAPIDGVGFQGHIESVTAPSEATLTASLGRFAQAGFAVAITELDVRVSVPANETMLTRQAAVYQSVLAACLATPRCGAFVTWGFTDRHSWVPAFFKRRGEALPFDTQLQPKDAYRALVKELQ